ncbi:HalOD1 output domain-containing protein [Halalkalicoccus salilacus]|uniref:HalOD1 output domain-containing protein n=1 Tax=Halalkalicoccus salilacus TaxID=3117459 RepID=UPI00300F53DC
MSDTNGDSDEHCSSGEAEHGYPIREGDLASEVVYTAIAELTGRSPMELAPLASVIDPDALDSIVASGTPAGSFHVSFEYSGHWVTVTTDEVALEPL